MVYKNGFTIVELLVVVVVIGVLAAITTISYTGISQKAIVASIQSDLNNASKQIKIFYTENGTYPNSVTDCPSPAIGNLCVKSNSGGIFNYYYSNTLKTFSITESNDDQTYTVAQNSQISSAGQNLLGCDTSLEKTSSSEFLQYCDLAPIFDNYGLRQYVISFDIKSANITNKDTILVYLQNGSGSRFGGPYNYVTVTTLFVRHSVVFTSTISNLSFTKSMLAFYGTYGTGNFPVVKNVKVEIGNVATPWTPAP